MNFQQLEYILAVNYNRHFTRAAEKCNVTQATLSAMIKKLEDELNIIIFDRSKKPVVPTEEGKELLRLAQKILNNQRAIYQINEKTEKTLEGNLNIGIIPTVANTLLPLIIKPLMNNHPKLSLHISELTTQDLIRQLKQNTLDLGIMATPSTDPSLFESILYYEAMMVYGVKNIDKKYVLPKDLENEEIWLLEEGHCFRTQSMTLCDIKEKNARTDRLEYFGASFDSLIHLTDELGGLTLIPELYYRLLDKEHQFQTRLFEKPIPVREISIVHARPYAKKQTIQLLSKEIKSIVNPYLITNSYASHELSILGI